MFGVGPGSLVYDADKMGLKAEDQRRKLDESLDVIMELMQGRMVTKKTDWFDLREARLQLKSYSQPMMEMAVASARSPTGALAGRQARHRHALDRRHLGRRAQGARQQLGRLRGERAGPTARRRTAASGASSPSPMWRRRASRRARTSSSAWRTSGATSPKSRPSPSSRPTSPATRPSIWCRQASPASARRTIACAISSGCGRARTAASAASCCWRTTGRTGRRRKRSYELMARYVHPHFQRNANALRDWSYDDAKAKYATAGAAIESRGAGGDRQVPGAQGLSFAQTALPHHCGHAHGQSGSLSPGWPMPVTRPKIWGQSGFHVVLPHLPARRQPVR